MAAQVDSAVSGAVGDLPPAWLDVTNALRFLVKDSRLQFHKVFTQLATTSVCISTCTCLG